MWVFIGTLIVGVFIYGFGMPKKDDRYSDGEKPANILQKLLMWIGGGISILSMIGIVAQLALW